MYVYLYYVLRNPSSHVTTHYLTRDAPDETCQVLLWALRAGHAFGKSSDYKPIYPVMVV